MLKPRPRADDESQAPRADDGCERDAVEPSTRAAASRWITLGLALVLLWSFALRAWFATAGLHSAQYWDERFSLANVGYLLSGSWAPANGWYPTLSYLPQAGLLALSVRLHDLTLNPTFAVHTGQDFTPSAYFLCRLLCVLYSTLSLLVCYRIGRRLFGASVGLLGALLLSASPWHIRAAVEFKPDPLVMLTTLLALEWALDAAERPSVGRYLLAGVGVALAASSKFNGALIAVALVVATAANLRRQPRAALWLGLAGATSIAVFRLLNPQYRRYFEAIPRIVKHYDQFDEPSYAAYVWRVGAHLVSEYFHGPVVGTLAIAGCAALVASLLRRSAAHSTSLMRAVFLSFPLGYVLVSGGVTRYAKENNFVILLPFTALLAAWLLAELWRRGVAPRSALLRRSFVAPVAALAFSAPLGWSGGGFVYDQMVPSSLRVACEVLRVDVGDLRSRVAYLERATPEQLEVWAWHGKHRSFLQLHWLERLSDLDHATLDRADAELFRASGLEGAEREFYSQRLARVSEASIRRIDTRPFQVRGDPLVVLLHTWRVDAGEELAFTRRDATRTRLAARLPELWPDGGAVSVELWTQPRARPRLFVSSVAGLEELPLWPSSQRGAVLSFITDHFPPPPRPTELFVVGVPPDSEPRLFASHWVP